MSFFKNASYFILNKKTEKQKWLDKVRIINELLSQIEKPEAKEPKQYAKNLATDFYLDSVVVSKKDGSVLMNTEEGDAFEKMVKASSMYEYVNSEFPSTKMMMIKDKNKYTIIYTEGDLIYMFKTTGEMSAIEAKRIAQQLNQGMLEYKLR